MSLKEYVIHSLEERRDRILNGYVNSIPSPYKRYSEDFIGIEQACYYTITAATKGSKSQFTSYTFIYNALLYCLKHPNIDIKIIYFPLEETPERIMQRFMSYLIYNKTGGKVRIPPRDLRSTVNAVPQNVLDMINEPDFQAILDYFEEHILFPGDITNPTGIYKWCKQYAEENGTVYTKPGKYKNEFGETVDTQVFDRYEQNNPNEYRLIIVDTINLIDTERGMTLKQSMDKLSEYLAKYLRNRYHYSPVVIQQQSVEAENNEAVKLGRYKPTVATMGDSKYTTRDSDIVLGLFSPYKFGLKEYMGYNIALFKDHIRFLEILVNRNGPMGGVCPLYFDGATCFFEELPLPNDEQKLLKYYNMAKEDKPNIIMFIKKLFNKLKK